MSCNVFHADIMKERFDLHTMKSYDIQVKNIQPKIYDVRENLVFLKRTHQQRLKGVVEVVIFVFAFIDSPQAFA